MAGRQHCQPLSCSFQLFSECAFHSALRNLRWSLSRLIFCLRCAEILMPLLMLMLGFSFQLGYFPGIMEQRRVTIFFSSSSRISWASPVCIPFFLEFHPSKSPCIINLPITSHISPSLCIFVVFVASRFLWTLPIAPR